MKTEETISRILTEFNFDRKTFDEARNELLILCNSSLQFKDKHKKDFDGWLLENRYMLIKGTYIDMNGWEKTREQLWLTYIEEWENL